MANRAPEGDPPRRADPTKGKQGRGATGESFAYSLTTGDYGNDGLTDLAIGVPYAGCNPGVFVPDAGEFILLFGSLNGLSVAFDGQPAMRPGLQVAVKTCLQTRPLRAAPGRLRQP